MKTLFRGMCKNCPHGIKDEKEETIYCPFGGIRDYGCYCNIRGVSKKRRRKTNDKS